MLRVFTFVFFFAISFVIGSPNPDIVKRFTKPTNCTACHEEQVKDWVTSLHAKSHEEKNELYHATVKFVSKELKQPYEATLLNCGKCHNPRLDVKSVDENYMLSKAFDVNTEEKQVVDEAISAIHIKNGVSCYVCHNIDSIKPKKSNNDVGYELINWIKGPVIVGPFEDESDRAKYHESKKRDFFVSGDELCLICHQGNGSSNALSTYNTGAEQRSSGDARRCVDCHMGDPKEGIIAPEIHPTTAIKRIMRSHIFAGVRNDTDLLKDVIFVDLVRNYQSIDLLIKNSVSHKIPSGFSGRSLMVKLTYKKGDEVLKSENIELKATYIDDKNLETLSYVATNLVSDTRLEPSSTKTITLYPPEGANTLDVELIYYILSPSLQYKLRIDSEHFTKPYEIVKKSFQLF